MSQLMKMMGMSKNHTPEAIKMAKDFGPKIAKVAKEHMPDASTMAKMHKKAEIKAAKGAMKVMPEKVKKVGIAKMLILPAASAVIALLFAPKSGKELRSDIKRSVTGWKDKGMDKAHDLMDEAKDAYNEAMQEGSSTVSDMPDSEPRSHSEDPSVGVGNVRGTVYEPHGDQTIPEDKLDEALEDIGISSDEELVKEEENRE